MSLGKVDKARVYYEQALGLYKKVSNRLGLANTLQLLGDLEIRQGNVSKARTYYEEAKGLFQKENASLGLANTFRALGDVEKQLGEVPLSHNSCRLHRTNPTPSTQGR